MDFGRVLAHTTTRKMMKERDLIKDIGNSVSNIVNGVKNLGNGALNDLENALKNIGSFDISKGVKFNVGVGTPALRTNIVTSAEWVSRGHSIPQSEPDANFHKANISKLTASTAI